MSRNSLVASLVLSLMIPVVAEAREVFEETFDDLPDYTSSEDLDLEGWSFRRNGEVNWSPCNGYHNKNDEFVLLEENAGKSFVGWRESFDPGWNRWNSDGILAKYFENGFDQLYVSFYVRFGDNWTPGGTSKLFRIYSWNGSGSPFQYFGDGNAGPIFLWDYNKNDYGLRNVHAYRGGPHGESYEMSGDDILDMPRNLNNLGDVGMAADGGTPEIVDQVKGGFISDDMDQTVSHEQVFGDSGNWTKVAFFVKMNSSPGVNDGVLIQWINNEQVFVNRKINWVDDNPDNKMVNWNVVAIGGNDFFQEYPNSELHEEWYSIDDVVIATEIPSDLGSDDAAVDGNPPRPPTGLSIE